MAREITTTVARFVETHYDVLGAESAGAALTLAHRAGVATLPVRISPHLKRSAGHYSYNRRTGEPAEIAMAEALWSESKAAVRQTFLHELAHAVAHQLHEHHGHGYDWRKVCEALGLRGEDASTHHDFAALRGIHVGTCLRCGAEVRRARRAGHFSRKAVAERKRNPAVRLTHSGSCGGVIEDA